MKLKIILMGGPYDGQRFNVKRFPKFLNFKEETGEIVETVEDVKKALRKHCYDRTTKVNVDGERMYAYTGVRL